MEKLIKIILVKLLTIVGYSIIKYKNKLYRVVGYYYYCNDMNIKFRVPKIFANVICGYGSSRIYIKFDQVDEIIIGKTKGRLQKIRYYRTEHRRRIKNDFNFFKINMFNKLCKNQTNNK